jgi:hypothetical protein
MENDKKQNLRGVNRPGRKKGEEEHATTIIRSKM